jgi:hypothetical protein
MLYDWRFIPASESDFCLFSTISAVGGFIGHSFLCINNWCVLTVSKLEDDTTLFFCPKIHSWYVLQQELEVHLKWVNDPCESFPGAEVSPDASSTISGLWSASHCGILSNNGQNLCRSTALAPVSWWWSPMLQFCIIPWAHSTPKSAELWDKPRPILLWAKDPFNKTSMMVVKI